MDRIKSTSIILLDQNLNANDVDIMVFEPSVLSPPPPQLGGIDDMVQKFKKIGGGGGGTEKNPIVSISKI